MPVILFSMRKKALAIIIAAAAAAAGVLAVVHFTRPSVAFIDSGAFPKGYDLPRPSSFFSYRMTGNPERADIVITAPDAVIPEGVDSYLFGRNALDGESPAAVLGIDEAAMWSVAAGEKEPVLLYEETSAVGKLAADSLGIPSVTYQGRISSANIEEISRQIPPEGTVLAITPATSMSLFRTDHSWSLVMDVRDAAAMDTTDCDAAVSIDWDATVMNLLSGKEELSYCLIPM